MSSFSERYGPWAVVTGANAGIGRAITTELARRKVNIVAIARRKELLDALKVELESQYRIDMLTLPLDLTAPDALEQLEWSTRGLDVGLIVPAAGTAVAGEFAATALERHQVMVHLNVIAPMQLVHLFAGRMAARGRGGVLLISSLFAYQGIPYVANYAATKAYILLLGEALHVELRGHGIDVTVLSPGLTRTDMSGGLPIDFSRLPMMTQSPATVGAMGIRALGRRTTIVSGVLNKFYAWQNRLLPRSVPVSLFGFLIRRALKQKVEGSS
jgi:uncharacterized protein